MQPLSQQQQQLLQQLNQKTNQQHLQCPGCVDCLGIELGYLEATLEELDS